MLRTGQKVKKLTKRVGQVAPVGKVIDVREESVQVRWDDGHVSIISKTAVTPVHTAGKT